MENDIISLFLSRKKRNISCYTEIFIKYTLKNNVKLSKIINKIIEIYIDSFYINDTPNYDLLTRYFEVNKAKESFMKDVLSSSLIFYQNSGLENQIESDINTIVILSNLIYLSLNLDEYINEYKHNSEDIEERIEKFLGRFRNKIKLSENDEILLTNELKNQVKKDAQSEKKFWKSLLNTNYILEFNRSLKNTNYYLVEYYYDIKMLNRYDKKEIDKTVLTKGINDDILTIYLEILSVFILKDLLSKNMNDLFFIQLYDDYFSKNKNLSNIERLYSNENIRKHIVFMFDYDDLKNSLVAVKTLHAKGFKTALRHLTDDSKLSANSFDVFDYVYIDSSILDKFHDYKDIWQAKQINFIIDNDEFIKIEAAKILMENR